MKKQDIVALKVNRKTLVRILSIDEPGWCAIELLEAPGLPLRVRLDDLVDEGITEPGKELEGSVNILGTHYDIKLMDESDRGYELGDGYIDFSTKEIYLAELDQDRVSVVKDLVKYQRKVLRHEIIHAFLYESGLDVCACTDAGYSRDEQLVDWIALQSPKIFKVFKEAGCEE